MADQRPGDDPTRVIRSSPGTSGSRAPDAPPGHGVQAPGARPPSDPPYVRPTAPRTPREPDGAGSGLQPSPRTDRKRRRIGWKPIVLVVVLALIVYPIALFFVAWRHLGRVDALPANTAATPGRTYLVVGSDSRKGLTKAQRRALHTGGDFGQRTDTIMLLHLPANGGPNVLMSIPRDSYVSIPGHGMNKINAAYAFGGPKLLAETIEKATGVQIDDYAEIGLGGFASIVDAVGGVQICPKRDMKDKDAGLNIKKGCQQANGAVALGYARARHSDPRGDLGRVERQREVLGAIVAKSSKPTTLVNPFAAFPLASSGAATLTIDKHTGPVALLRFLLGMKSAAGGDGLSLTVPISGTANRPGAGSVVLWDQDQADIVFKALRDSDTRPIIPIAAEQKKLTG
ncbi:LCP family protein [Angustibacter sp. McL0619]|uniref:LCP family protein n=1 Tax=Angustibacter sp. McL0619 TaxID=3415676 RepID=UPI003CF37A6F